MNQAVPGRIFGEISEGHGVGDAVQTVALSFAGQRKSMWTVRFSDEIVSPGASMCRGKRKNLTQQRNGGHRESQRKCGLRHVLDLGSGMAEGRAVNIYG